MGDPSGDSGAPEGNTWITRRRVLQSLGSSTLLGATGFTGRQPKTEIPFLLSGEEVVEYRTVPQAYKARSEKVRNLLPRVRSEFGAKNGVTSVSITPSEEKIGKLHLSQIRIRADPGKLDTDLPSELNGVPVETSPPLDLKPSCDPRTFDSDCLHNDTYTDIPGGALVFNHTSSENGNIGTTGCKVTTDNGQFMLTAAHLREGSCSDPENTSKIDHGCDEVADFQYGHGTHDYAYMESTSSQHSWSNDIYSSSGWICNIVGRVAENAVDYISNHEDETVQKVGVHTGHLTGGNVIDHHISNAYSCYDLDGHGVVSDLTQSEGDSGTIVFWGTGDNKYIVHMGTAQGGNQVDTNDCGGTDLVEDALVAGYAGYEIRNERSNVNLSFGN